MNHLQYHPPPPAQSQSPQQDDTEDDADGVESVNWLASSSPETNNHGADDEDDDPAMDEKEDDNVVAAPSESPATQTLNAFSQSQEWLWLPLSSSSQQQQQQLQKPLQPPSVTVHRNNNNNNSNNSHHHHRPNNESSPSSLSPQNDFSQLERDVVHALVRTKHVRAHPDDIENNNNNNSRTQKRPWLLSPSTTHKRQRRRHGDNEEDDHTDDNDETTTLTDSLVIIPEKRHGRAIPVHQIDIRTGAVVQTFATLSQAARQLGCSRHVVTDLLRGDNTRAYFQGRYTFRYNPPPAKPTSSHRHPKTNPKKRAVPQQAPSKTKTNIIVTASNKSTSTTTTNTTASGGRSIAVERLLASTGRVVQIHASLKAAGEHVGCSRWKIKDILEQDQIYNGYRIRYHYPDAAAPSITVKKEEEEEDTTTTNPVPTRVAPKVRTSATNTTTITTITAPYYYPSNNANISIPVHQIDVRTGSVVHTYTSLTAASKATGIKRRAITNIVRGGGEDPDHSGYTFRYAQPPSDPGRQDGDDKDDDDLSMAEKSNTAVSQQTTNTVLVLSNANHSQESAVSSSSTVVSGHQKGKPRAVYAVQVATQQVQQQYPTISTAIAATKIKASTMYKILRGDLAEWQGLTFCYCDNTSTRTIMSQSGLLPSTAAVTTTTTTATAAKTPSTAQVVSTVAAQSQRRSNPLDSSSDEDDDDDDSHILVSRNNGLENASSPVSSAGRHARSLSNSKRNDAELLSSPCRLLLELAQGTTTTTTTTHPSLPKSDDGPSLAAPVRHTPADDSRRRVSALDHEHDDPAVVDRDSRCDAVAAASDPSSWSLASIPKRTDRSVTEGAKDPEPVSGAAAKQQCQDDDAAYDGCFETRSITVQQEGPLGIRILPTPPPPELVLYLRQCRYLPPLPPNNNNNSNDDDDSEAGAAVIPKIMRVVKVFSPSICGDAGAQPGDWLLVPRTDGTGVHVAFKDVKRVIQEGSRPLACLVVRLRGGGGGGGDDSNNTDDNDSRPKQEEDDAAKENDRDSSSSSDNKPPTSASDSQDAPQSENHGNDSRGSSSGNGPNAEASHRNHAEQLDVVVEDAPTSEKPKELSNPIVVDVPSSEKPKDLSRPTAVVASKPKVILTPGPHATIGIQLDKSTDQVEAVALSKPKAVPLSSKSNEHVSKKCLPKRASAVQSKHSCSTKSSSAGSTRKRDAAPAVVPFCHLCQNPQGAGRRAHHAWCPKNPQFVKSGARDILKRLQQGAHELNCSACIQVYETGRTLSESKHSKVCRRMKKEDLLEDDDDNDKKKKTKTRKKQKTPASSQRSSRKEDVVKDDDDDDRSHASGMSHLDSNDDGSVFASPEKPGRRAFLKLELVKPKPIHSHKEPRILASQPARKPKTASIPSNQSKIRRSAAVTFKTAKASSQAPSTAALPPLQNTAPTRFAMGSYDDETSDDDNDLTDTLKVAWETCDDVWGPAGHLDDDVVVFTTDANQQTACYDSFLPVRFEMDLFSPKARYGKTHTSPAQGFQTIVLTRDFAGQRPWGFACERHEFGGACLVKAVDPLSPAGGAVLVGAGSWSGQAPLCVNDLLVLVNGKMVGGMTSQGLEFELATSGAELILTVARYKFAAQVQEGIAQVEASYLEEVDETVNDDMRLGWTDIGGGSLEADAIPDGPVVVEVGTDSSEPPPSCSEVLPDDTVHDTGNVERMDWDETASLQEKSGQRVGSTNDDAIESESDKETLTPPTPKGSPKVKNTSVLDGDSSSEDDELPRLESSPFRLVLDDHDHSIASPSSSESTISGRNNDDDADDGNAWYGCVCGKIHSEMVPVFWIQCEVCHSWYNVDSSCVGFAEAAANHVEHWSCWGCPSVTSMSRPKVTADQQLLDVPTTGSAQQQSSHCLTSPKTGKNSHGIPSSKAGTKTTSGCSVPSDDESESDEESSKSDTEQIVPFKKGDLVLVREHAWSRVNNPAGVAKILMASVDEKGKQVYDIKYVVDRSTHRGVLHKYLSPNSF